MTDVLTPNEHGETVGSIINDEYEGMLRDWKLINEQREELERRLSYLANSLGDFFSNWLAPLDHKDRAGNWQ